jgi:hypothetical protein
VLARNEGGELRAPLSALNDLLRDYAGITSRKHALDLGVPTTFTEERTLRAPGASKIRFVPKSGEVKSRFGSLSLALNQSGQEVTSKVSLVITVDRVEPRDYAEYRRFIEQADELLRQRVAFAPESR